MLLVAVLRFGGLLLFVFAVAAAKAQEPEIAVEVGASEIYIGESVDYYVEIRNTKQPAPPDMAALRDDFDVVANGDESRNQQSVSIINGRVTQRNSFSHLYRFRLTPKRTGDLTIAAPSATIEGQVLAARALPLSVIAPEEQDLVVPEIRIDRSKVYPTQPFEVTLRVKVRPLPNDPDRDPLAPLRRQPPHIEVNWVEPPGGLTVDQKSRWLEQVLSDDGVGFTLNDVSTQSGSFFEGPRLAVFNLRQGGGVSGGGLREAGEGLDGSKIDYFVYELKRSFTPEKAGTYRFGPAMVKGSFVDGVEGRGISGGGLRDYTARRLVAVAPAVAVEVREVPTPRPATFCGGIGSYEVAASAVPTTLRVGDPLTLTLDVRRGHGAGQLDLISAPDLSGNSRLIHDFEIIDKNPTGRIEGGLKRFAYALRPRRAGANIPSLSLTVFDPDADRFSEIATKPIALEVSDAGRIGAGDLVGSLPSSGTQEIKSREQGIFQNVTDPSELTDQRVGVAACAAAAAGSWCAVGLLIAGVTNYRRKSGEAGWKRRQQARRAANGKLAAAREARAQGRPQEALRAARAAIVGLIADMRNVVAEGLTAAEADAVLAATAIPADQRAAVLQLLEAIESAEYGSFTSMDAAATIDAAERLIPIVARQLERETR